MTFFSRASRAVAGTSVLAVLFVVGGTATAAFAVSTAWSPPVNVSTTGGNENLRIAVDASGLATAVWDNSDGNDHFIVQASTSLNGAPWSSPATLDTPGAFAYPQIAVDGSGRATAVWHHYDTTIDTVQASFSVNGGTWSTPTTVSTTGHNSYPQITVNGSGRATALWISQSGTNYTVQASFSVNGAAWSTPATLDTAGAFTYSQITVDGSGRATAVWVSHGIDSGLRASSSLDGAAWSTPVNVSAAGEIVNTPQITVDWSGLATAVWDHDEGNNQFIVQASSSLNGAAWSTPATLATALGQEAHPQITVDGSGRASAVWQSSDASNDIVQASTSLDGAAWSTPANLSTAGQDAYEPQITVDGSGLATAVWRRFDGARYIVQASTSLNGAAWSTPDNLSTVGQNAAAPQITVNKSGFASAAWLRADGDGFSTVQASFFDSRATGAPVLAATGVDTATIAPTTIFALLVIVAGIGMIHLRRRKQAPPALGSSTGQQHYTRAH